MAGRPRRRERLAREAQARAERGEPAPRLSAPPTKAVKPTRERQHVIKGAHGDPLAIFREGLALARRAGMPWEQALEPTLAVALSVESCKREREQWTVALDATITVWRSAYEHRPTGIAL